MTILANTTGSVSRYRGLNDRAGSTQATASDPEEVSFFTYRLDVLSRWPRSHRRDALIAATLDRLRALGMDRD